MDSFILSSNGANDLICNNITSDNVSVISSLTVSSINILSSLGNINTNLTTINTNLTTINTNLTTINSNLNNINGIINSSSSSLNITGTTNINFNVGTQLTTINISGLSIFHNGTSNFPYSYAGMYNIADRLNSLYASMSDSPECLINFDSTHNTVIRIREQDIVNQIYYPRQLQIQSYQGTAFSKFDIQGLQLLDTNNNWYYINKMFTMTNNSILLCSNKTMIDNNGNLNVYTSGNTWLSVANNLSSSTASISSILDQINTLVGGVAAITAYYSNLLTSAAVIGGIVIGSGLLLALNLKEDHFDVKPPLYKRAPVILNGEYFNELELKYNSNLILDTSNYLSINTAGFLTPYYGDLSLASTPGYITSTSSTYVVVTQLTQPITCVSSLNVSGYTKFLNNVTCLSSLNINGTLNCNTINSSTINNLSSYSNLNISNLITTTNSIFSNLNTMLNINSLHVSGSSIFINNSTILSSLNVSGRTIIGSNIYNYSDSSLEVNKNVIIRNNITDGSIVLLQAGTDYNASFILMEEGKDMIISTPVNSTSQAMLNLNSNKGVNINSSLNITGRTLIGTTFYNRSDSILEVNKNLSIRNNITTGSRIDLQTGTGYGASYISMEEGFDINISTPYNTTSTSVISLTSNKAINLNAPKTYISNDIVIYGSLSCLNVGKKTPIYFTTNRNININGTTFSCYDINLNKYTGYILLDGYNTRQFRLRTWLADGDVQNVNMRIIRADIFMTDKNGLSIWALCAPLQNDNLNSTDIYLDQFLYRDTFNNIIYCSRFGAKKVYCIFEDLL